MEYYKIKSTVPIGKPVLFSSSMLADRDFVSRYLCNHFGELGVDIIVFKKVEEDWVKMTRLSFAAEVDLACRVTGEEGDTLEGAVPHPVVESLDEESLLNALKQREVGSSRLAKHLIPCKGVSNPELVSNLMQVSGYKVTANYVQSKLDADEDYHYYELRGSDVEGVLLCTLSDERVLTVEVLAVKGGEERASIKKHLILRLHSLGEKLGVTLYVMKSPQTVGTSVVLSDMRIKPDSLKRIGLWGPNKGSKKW